MKVLGLWGFGSNPGVALLDHGKLLAHVEEERFTGFKGSHGLFPKKSVHWVLSEFGLDFSDVDLIAWPWDQSAYLWQMPLFYAKSFFRHFSWKAHSQGQSTLKVFSHLLDQQPRFIRSRIHQELNASGVTGRMPSIQFVSHHLSHAASAYFMSGYDHAHVIVMDGSGEQNCSSIFFGSGKELQSIDSFQIPNSLGWFYAAATEYLGFIPYRDEGKVMGLAAYGGKQADVFRKMQKIIQCSDYSYRVDPKYTLLGPHTKGIHYSDHWQELFGPPRPYNTTVSKRDKDIAFAVQYSLEAAACSVVRRAQKKSASANLCLSGGISLNCKMNGRLRNLPGIESLFVQPSGNDAGSALGAALLMNHKMRSVSGDILNTTYFGPSYKNEAIKSVLTNSGVVFRRPRNLAAKVGQALAQKKIVAVYRNRSEFGARALGNRSILANPQVKGIRDRVNKQVKFREAWRPFCPSILEEDVKEFLVQGERAPFMTVAYRVRPERQKELEAVVHIDGTVRPQTLSRLHNEFFWKCVNEFKKHSGIGLVMNTSFNLRGKPIVEKPEDALACFYSSGLDAMAIGDYWVEK